MIMPVVLLLMPAWQLKTIGVEAEVFLNIGKFFTASFDGLHETFLPISYFFGILEGKMVMKLFRVSCRVWFSIYIDNWFLSEVDPIDVFLIFILLLNGFKALIETCQCGLTSTKNWKSRHPSEVRGSFCVWGLFDQFVHTLKVVGHSQTIVDVRHFGNFYYPGLLKLKFSS